MYQWATRIVGALLLFWVSGPLSYAAPRIAQPDSAATVPGPTDSQASVWKFLAKPADTVLSPDLEGLLQSFGEEKWDCNKTRECAVERLIKGTLQVDLAKAKADYVVIHIADYRAPDKKTTDAWYLYRTMDANWGDPKWDFSKFIGQRIYGAKSVMFLFVHLHARAISFADARQKVSDALKAARDERAAAEALVAPGNAPDKANQVAKERLAAALGTMGLDPELASDLIRVPKDLTPAQIDKALKSGALTFSDPARPTPPTTIQIVDKATGDHFRWLGDEGVPNSYANVHYEAAVVKRTPANVQDLIDVGKILGLANASTKNLELETTSTVALWGAGQIASIGLPSQISIAGYNKGADEPMTDEDRPTFQIGSVGSFNDEQLYWWDASIGIPVHKIKDLQYSSSNNTVVASQVDRQSAYAMFNVVLHPVDLLNPKDNVWPRILVGFPLASSPWDNLFAGAAVGLPLKPFRNFQFFAGATFNRNKQPATLGAGSTATDAQLQNDLRIQMTPKFTFGINVPVASVLKSLLR